MPEAQQTLVFDPEAYKTRLSEGPFASKAAVIAACRPMDATQPHWQQYQQWAQQHAVTGNSIILSVNSPGYLEVRRSELEKQLRSFQDARANPESTAGGGYPVPEALSQAFNAAANTHKSGTFKVMLMNSLRYISYFDLRKSFPTLDIHAICAAPTQDHARQCNELIQTVAPELADNLEFSADWQDENYFHLVNVDFAAIYFDQEQLDILAENIAATCSDHVIFSNIARNPSQDGTAQWMGQRAFGGIIPYRIPAKDEIINIMTARGYKVTRSSVDPLAYKGDPTSAIVKTPDERDNFSFSRNAAALEP